MSVKDKKESAWKDDRMTVETVRMPRLHPRPGRAEAMAARRIEWERKRPGRNWSREELARRMTEAGCPLNQSAIQKIEHGVPRRTISLDEALAFAEVFGLGDLDELWSMPAEIIGTEIARYTEAVELITAALAEIRGIILQTLDTTVRARADAQPMFDYMGNGAAPGWPAIGDMQDSLAGLADLTLKVRDDLGKLRVQ